MNSLEVHITNIHSYVMKYYSLTEKSALLKLIAVNESYTYDRNDKFKINSAQVRPAQHLLSGTICKIQRVLLP